MVCGSYTPRVAALAEASASRVPSQRMGLLYQAPGGPAAAAIAPAGDAVLSVAEWYKPQQFVVGLAPSDEPADVVRTLCDCVLGCLLSLPCGWRGRR